MVSNHKKEKERWLKKIYICIWYYLLPINLILYSKYISLYPEYCSFQWRQLIEIIGWVEAIGAEKRYEVTIQQEIISKVFMG